MDRFVMEGLHGVESSTRHGQVSPSFLYNNLNQNVLTILLPLLWKKNLCVRMAVANKPI